jgi:CRISPR-associated protein Cas1
VADLYKHLTSIPAAFQAVRQDPNDDGELTRKLLKQRVEEEKILQRMPKDLEALFAETAAPAAQPPA